MNLELFEQILTSAELHDLLKPFGGPFDGGCLLLADTVDYSDWLIETITMINGVGFVNLTSNYTLSVDITTSDGRVGTSYTTGEVSIRIPDMPGSMVYWNNENKTYKDFNKELERRTSRCS